MSVPYCTWASLEEIDRADAGEFDHVFEHSGGHAEKLNRLAAEILATADDDDLLMFLDGDAFPIADPSPLVSGLSRASLVAVRRSENGGEPHPHPSFCVTTVGTWRDLPGDWSKGFVWRDSRGNAVTDTGANLLARLESRGLPWIKIPRTNRHKMHPVFFGVYGDRIYHHGAGFRLPFSRVDLWDFPADSNPDQTGARERANRHQRLSTSLFERIRRDDPDWLEEIRRPGSPAGRRP